MKKKHWIILIVAVVLIGILFLFQHSSLYRYGCQKACESDPKRGICANINYRYKCSFRTFITNDYVSEKLFLWFGIDTRSLKKKQSSHIISDSDDDGVWDQIK